MINFKKLTSSLKILTKNAAEVRIQKNILPKKLDCKSRKQLKKIPMMLLHLIFSLSGRNIKAHSTFRKKKIYSNKCLLVIFVLDPEHLARTPLSAVALK